MNGEEYAKCARRKDYVFFISPLGPCWAYVGPMLAYVSPSLAYVGPVLALRWPMLAPCWPILWPMLRLCWRYGDTISVERPPRCQCFLPGPLRGTKNHVKATFFHIADTKIVLVQARKTRKKQCFRDYFQSGR